MLTRLKNRFHGNAHQVLGKTAELVRIVKRFEKKGIPVLPFKGPVLALQAHGNVGSRHVGDLDMMVLLGLTQGVGLLMLIPFLRLIGLEGGESPGGLAAHMGRVFAGVGLPLTMLSILCVYVGIVVVHAMVARYREVLNTKIIYGFTQVLRNGLYQALCRNRTLGWYEDRQEL